MSDGSRRKTGNIVFLEPHEPQNRPFHYPHQLLRDASLSLAEKRAILAAWASDAHAVDSLPVLRHLPGTPFPVTLSSVMSALAWLDRVGEDDDPPPPPAREKPARPQEAA